MTISSSAYRVQITTGSTIIVTGLEAQAASQIVVVHTDSEGVLTTLTNPTDYTVDTDITTVTLVTALAASEKATATLAIPTTQNKDYKYRDAFNSETVETALDKLTLQDKSQAESLSRALQLSVSDTTVSTTLPDTSSAASKILGINSAGTGWEFTTIVAGGVASNILSASLNTNGFDINVSEDNVITFEGATDDDYETTLTVVDPTADRTVSLPDATDTLVGKATTDTLTNKTLTSPVLNTGVSGTAILDEDDMTSDSATKLATQQSIKAYVDTEVAGAAGGGKVLQVISATKTDTFSTTSTSFTDLTGVTVNITPASTSNKILVIATVNIGTSGAGKQGVLLVRDSTGIALGDTAGSRGRASAAGDLTGAQDTDTVSLNYLDSPSKTSPTTYKIQVAASAGTLYVNRTSTDTNSAAFLRTASTITVMEIEG